MSESMAALCREFVTSPYRAYRTYRVRTGPFLSIKREMFRRIMGEKTPVENYTTGPTGPIG